MSLSKSLIGTTMMTALSVATVAHAANFHCANQRIQCLVASITEANTNGNPTNTIWLDGDTYILADVNNNTDGPNGLPSITSKLTIVALQTANIVRAASAPRFRLIQVAAGGNLTLSRVTLINGAASSPGGGTSVSEAGGGVLNDGGVVTISASTFLNNSADQGGGLLNNGGLATLSSSTFWNNSADSTGGALVNLSGKVVIDGCTFNQNDALSAGGIYSSNGTMQINRSLITNNKGHFNVAGLFVSGGTVWVDHSIFAGNVADGIGIATRVEEDGTLVVTDSAFVANRAVINSGAAAIGNIAGNVFVSNTTFARNVVAGDLEASGPLVIDNLGKLTLLNNTFAGNVRTPISRADAITALLSTADTGGANTIMANTMLAHKGDDGFLQDCSGPVTSFGSNIIGDTTGCGVRSQGSDRTGDPGLGAFVDDGTPGNEHFALLPGSQAIDAGNPFLCPRKDQIGQARVGNCDIGSIEFGGR